MVNDEQTQTLPAERAELERFARVSSALPSRDAFAKVLLDHLDKVQRHYSRLFENAPGADRPALAFPAEADDRKTLDRLAELGFRAPLEASAIVRHWLAGGHRSLKGEYARAAIWQRCCRCCSSNWRAPTIPTRRWCCSTISSPICIAGAAVVAAAAKSRSDRADRAGARHRAAACRHAGALSAGDGRAGRSEFLRRAAGRRRTRPPARCGAGASALRRGPARTHPHVRAGIHVPDRRAHPFRHGDGAAGGRSLRAAGRRGDPRRAPRGRPTISRSRTAICAARRPRCWPWASSAGAR